MDALPKDVVTLIFSHLSNQSRLALLAAAPQLATAINWSVLYHQKYNPLMVQFRKLHAKHFPITKQERLVAMQRYYSKTKRRPNEEDDDFDAADYDIRDIPIIVTNEYKVQDYEYEITDYIYDDILEIKFGESLNK